MKLSEIKLKSILIEETDPGEKKERFLPLPPNWGKNKKPIFHRGFGGESQNKKKAINLKNLSIPLQNGKLLNA